jgi:antirestriction protein ArdC
MSTDVPSHERFDVYRTVTDKIVQAIETGVGPCIMPWHGLGGQIARPVNALTKAAYRGVNVVALWAQAAMLGYHCGTWASYRQWQQAGAQVRKGERGTTIVFFKEIARENFGEPDGDVDRPRLIARASRVFNAAQVDGWSPPAIASPSRVEVIESADAFVRAAKADIRHGEVTACYRPAGDYIELPALARFRGTPTSSPTESYYAVLLHELTHWTGAKHRLDRELNHRFGDSAYAMEELIAELGAAFLCADLSVTHEPRPDHAAYINSWLRVLKNDRKAIFVAASRASQAAEYLADLAKQGA